MTKYRPPLPYWSVSKCCCGRPPWLNSGLFPFWLSSVPLSVWEVLIKRNRRPALISSRSKRWRPKLPIEDGEEGEEGEVGEEKKPFLFVSTTDPIRHPVRCLPQIKSLSAALSYSESQNIVTTVTTVFNSNQFLSTQITPFFFPRLFYDSTHISIIRHHIHDIFFKNPASMLSRLNQIRW